MSDDATPADEDDGTTNWNSPSPATGPDLAEPEPEPDAKLPEEDATRIRQAVAYLEEAVRVVGGQATGARRKITAAIEQLKGVQGL